jgi:hypothetical protein
MNLGLMTDNRFRDGKHATADQRSVGLSKMRPSSVMLVTLLQAEVRLSMEDIE